METVSGAGGGSAGEKTGGISGSTIKLIAVAAMLVDHTAAVILARLLVERGYSAAYWGGESQLAVWMEHNGVLYYTYEVMRGIGRLGFPVFCFLLVEGFRKTRNLKKYAMRLGIFALVSEVPFNLALAGRVWEPRYQNVYFTLFLGLLVLCAYGFFGKKKIPDPAGAVFMVTGVVFPGVYFGTWLGIRLFSEGGGSIADYLPWSEEFPVRFWGVCLALCLALAVFLFLCGRKRGAEWIRRSCADLTALTVIMYAAELLQTDYAGMGVLAIAVMYGMRSNPRESVAAGSAVLTIMSLNELLAFFAVIPAARYNGKRGIGMKYLFYVFYPLHLFALYLAAVWMGLGHIKLM